MDQASNRTDAASISATILEEEEARREALEEASADTVLPDDLLPGVGDEEMTFREGIQKGGKSMMLVLLLLAIVEEFDRVAITVLGPDIQKSLNISDTMLLGLGSFGGVVLVLSTIPFAWFSDRYRRLTVLSMATAVWGGLVAFTGAAQNAFQLAIGRAGSGVGAGAKIPISPSLIADQYPIAVRARVFAAEALGRPTGQVIGPFIAGGIVALAGEGPDDWRIAFYVFALPAILLVIAVFFLKEPSRGKYEHDAVLGKALEKTEEEPPVRLSSAFQRLKNVRSFYYLVVGIGVLGFALVAVPTTMSLLLEEVYGYGAFKRGWIISVSWSAALVAIPIAGKLGDKLFRKDPKRALWLMGALVTMYGVFVTVGVRFTDITFLIIFYTLGNACQGAAFTQMGPTISAVVPYRMRAQAFSLVGVYIFLMGGFFGGLLTGAFSDAYGERTALTIVVPPAALIGGSLIMYGSRFMKRDISLVVEELLSDQEEQQRAAKNPDQVPVLQVQSLNVSYGNLQVLFDVEFEVRRGETLALLGTNGAGKSTALRAISGLKMPDRGVVRMNGRDITLVDPEYRVTLGMVQVPGGEALFTGQTVGENLEVWSWLIEDPIIRKERQEKVFDIFPQLTDRLDDKAGSLSGGQQQMLALGKALMLEPELLLIDELSLGLAPVVVQDLLVVVEQLKKSGITMVIVEQSVNVALSIADRAIFMERGRIQFQGPAQELLERDDLLRAVFLSGEGA
ncbi:MAG: ATP-binding protein [Acidimicrobiales bacterium]|mgnify:CR=1 FL=1|nr:ATP-binding protein [Acidimicrobiales bacterium]MDG1846300.1 ATP-binding protein [Acidimicrobiales bacterium]